MTERPSQDPVAPQGNRQAALGFIILFTLLSGLPLTNLYWAIREGRIYHAGRSWSRWVMRSENPGFFWYDVITSLLLLGFLSFLTLLMLGHWISGVRRAFAKR